jgi:hypothetical protein
MELEVMGPACLENYEEGIRALTNSLKSEDCYFTTTGQFGIQQIVLMHSKVRRDVIQHIYNHRLKVKAGQAEPYKVGAVLIDSWIH